MSSSEYQPIDKPKIEADLAEVMRQGIKSFSYTDLNGLADLVILQARKPGKADWAPENLYPSGNRLRSFIMTSLSTLEPVQRAVGLALFGADEMTAELLFGPRQDEAGRRYNPSRPVARHAIRKKPYGQQWKIITQLADDLIRSETAGREQQQKGPWSIRDETHPTDSDPGSSRSEWPRSLPHLPTSQAWENRVGYRWLDYHAHLDCSPDYLHISITTKLHIEVLRPGIRTYFHTYEPRSNRHPHLTGKGAQVDFPATKPPAAPITYVGRVSSSPRHPTWMLDYFDLGEGLKYEEVVYIVFRHTYDHLSGYRPTRFGVVAEFDGVAEFRLSAYCFPGHEGHPEQPAYYLLREGYPVAGLDYHLELSPTTADNSRFLRNPADLAKTQELTQRSQELTDQLFKLEDEYQSYFDYPDLDED
jgi:hypothetical protein